MDRAARNRVGMNAGYGWCLRCHDTWDWKIWKTIKISDGRGAFPLCEECFDEADAREIKVFIDVLIREWQQHACLDEDYEEIRAALYRSVDEMKGEPIRKRYRHIDLD